LGTNCSTADISDEEINYKKRELVKITDLLGKETKGMKNQSLCYIYRLWSGEKRIIIE